MFKKAWWLGLPSYEIIEKKIYHGDLNGRFAYYRCRIDLPKKSIAIHIISLTHL